MSDMVGRERLIERKIVSLEQRLVLLERFVEMRFCESYRDFSIRSTPALFSKDDHQQQNTNSSKIDNVKKKREAVARINLTEDEDNSDDHQQEVSRNTSPSTPASVVADADEDGQEEVDLEATKTSYRTRSGRKSTRLTVLGKSSRESKQSTSSSPKAKEITNSRKVLKVHIARLNLDSGKPSQSSKVTAGDNPDTSIVKVNYDTADDEVENGGDGDYFTFPSGAEDAYDDSEEMREERDGSRSDSVNPGNEDDDWNEPDGEEGDVDDDEDFKPGDKSDKKKSKATASNATKTTPSTKRKRKKYNITSRIDLIPEGAQLQLLNTTLKECPFCHKHWKPEKFDMHVSTHVKERPLKCRFCGQQFYGKNAHKTHEKLHELDKYGVKCRLCAKLFLGNYKRRDHERICIRKHLEEGKYVDPTVMEDVRENSKNVDLKWPDSKEELPEGMKKCIHCKRLIAEDLFMGHIKEFHAKWKCSFCENTFVLKSGLVRHLNRTHGKHRVTCEHCNKTFENRGFLRGHNEQCRKERGIRNLKRGTTGKPKEESDTPVSGEQNEMEVEASLDSTSAGEMSHSNANENLNENSNDSDVDVLK